jgi:hypothetical protein
VNPQGLVDLVTGDMPGGVGVPMVSQFGANIPNWNANVLQYVDFGFIFVNKFCPKMVPSSFFTRMTYKFSNKSKNS